MSQGSISNYPGTSATSSQDDTIDLVFMCKVEKSQPLAAILGAVNLSKDKSTVIFIIFSYYYK